MNPQFLSRKISHADDAEHDENLRIVIETLNEEIEALKSRITDLQSQINRMTLMVEHKVKPQRDWNSPEFPNRPSIPKEKDTQGFQA